MCQHSTPPPTPPPANLHVPAATDLPGRLRRLCRQTPTAARSFKLLQDAAPPSSLSSPGTWDWGRVGLISEKYFDVFDIFLKNISLFGRAGSRLQGWVLGVSC